MDWNQSRAAYYFDFALVPALMLAVLIQCHSGYTAAGAALGLAIWTYAEYWIHRLLFHHVFARAHNLHHKRPRGYVAAPVWLTALVHGPLCIGAISLGGLAAGIVVGLEAGYLAYIVVHDRIHHGPKILPRWLARRARLHDLHHKGVEANFGVVSSICDRLHGTHLEGLDAKAWKRVNKPQS
jgi:sterol desaturase/sphingolipid hydroxylase (fatty acid hydroxylase superfamily)